VSHNSRQTRCRAPPRKRPLVIHRAAKEEKKEKMKEEGRKKAKQKSRNLFVTSKKNAARLF